ncbi:YbaK/ebsC protein [Treponema primitia ZAS-2]|uniref:Cys-tRNA(Pro)/Cys-tRNA(Cys) deacylase n=1 Tax=Treponema primitia (strain ATCC BAA-887 / DSM 12427 / ZAS-2) TaxID=545694 RepID=F5YL10_TREPZ|nr:Cys-tRNA(Pro) deacylase [Treponema primitia]AEF84054.1 YbaK/ebsC protein [Treponema primitia ZAS-2]
MPKPKPVKTNAQRLLDAAGIQYTIAEYQVDEGDLSGVHAAELLGIPAERVFKTLVLQGASGAYIVCCIPVAEELDLKKLARLAGEKKADLIPQGELLSITGYIRGGCSPIGMKKQFPTYIDETAELFETIAVSAGARGCQLILAPGDLIRYSAGSLADLSFRPGPG